MVVSWFLICVAGLAVCVLNIGALDTFKAAVYEHAVILPTKTEKSVSREEALRVMNENLNILETAIKKAAQQGAQIIVTPEDGLYGWIFTRDTIYPYLEDIPDPFVNWIPCTEPHRFNDTPVQKRLSCLAKENSIYVVANIGDKKPCNASDTSCPTDGHYQYNTDVVFDSDGKLVARYHKHNLFYEYQFDVPREPELVTFNTTFGKFGIFTCFDILFHDPAITLVRELKVDTILFPTAWMNLLPFLTAIEFHSAWAMGMGVNLLAANTHNTSKYMTGSGLYAPQSPKKYHYDMETETGKLILSELESHPRLSPTYPPAINWTAYSTSIKPFPTQKDSFKGFVGQEEFTFTELVEQAGNLTVCQKGLCCHLSYAMETKLEDLYVLGAFNGLHGNDIKYYWQVCTLLKCSTNNLTTCGNYTETAQTTFQMFSLSGTFETQYVFPEVLTSGIHLAPEQFQVLKDGRLENTNLTRPILTVTLFGRFYERDPPKSSHNLGSALVYSPLLVSSLLMIIITNFFMTA